MAKFFSYLGVVFLFGLLVLVRAFQTKLFYDPFINYFKDDYLHQEIPQFNSFQLYLNIFFRYVLNSIVSIGIIYLLFQKQFLKFSIQFYIISFIILIILFTIILNFKFNNYLPLFYLRRFLIHPIFVLLLIPALYYQKQNA